MKGACLPLFYLPAEPHRLGQPKLAWPLQPDCLAAGNLSTKCRENLKVLKGTQDSGVGGGTESVTGHLPPHASEAAGRTASRRVTDIQSVLLKYDG